MNPLIELRKATRLVKSSIGSHKGVTNEPRVLNPARRRICDNENAMNRNPNIQSVGRMIWLIVPLLLLGRFISVQQEVMALPPTPIERTPTPPPPYRCDEAIAVTWAARHDSLGAPKMANPVHTADGVGYYQNFTNGAVYCYDRSTGAHEVHGDIYQKWLAFGSERNLPPEQAYGYPVTDELDTGDVGFGRYNLFQARRSIYLTPTYGAHTVYGAIRAYWVSMGSEQGWLGYPKSDEKDLYSGSNVVGRWNEFQNGNLYYYYSSSQVTTEAPAPPSPPSPPQLSSNAEPRSGCRTGVFDFGKLEPEWVPVDLDWHPQVAEGVVRGTHVGGDENPLTHEQHDLNFEVHLDPQYVYLLSDASNRINWKPFIGERTIEAEWDIAHFPASPWWPLPGDRVWMVGRWVWDCGEPPYQTELHPPQFLATIRDEERFFNGISLPLRAKTAYIHIAGKGGDQPYLWGNRRYEAQTMSYFYRDYQFDIPLPPKPRNAVLVTDAGIVPLGATAPALTPILDDPNHPKLRVRIRLNPPPNAVGLFGWDDVPGRGEQTLKNYVSSFFPDLSITAIRKIAGTNLIEVAATGGGLNADCNGEPFFFRFQFKLTDFDGKKGVIFSERPRYSGCIHTDVDWGPPFPLEFLPITRVSGRIGVSRYAKRDSEVRYDYAVSAAWSVPGIVNQPIIGESLRVTFDKIKLYVNQPGSWCIDTRTQSYWPPPIFLWLHAGSEWRKLELTSEQQFRSTPTWTITNSDDNGEYQELCYSQPFEVPLNQVVDILVPETGGFEIRGTGYIWAPRDNYLGQPWPGLVRGALSYLFGDLGHATTGIGDYGKFFNRSSSPPWGTGSQTLGLPNQFYTLYFHIEKLATYGGNINPK